MEDNLDLAEENVVLGDEIAEDEIAESNGLYNVTFNTDGGAPAPAAQSVDEYVSPVANPTKTGYTFTGWYDNGTLHTIGETKITKDTELKAGWAPVSVTVKFFWKSASDASYPVTPNATESVLFNELIDQNKVPAAYVSGRKVAGWYTTDGTTGNEQTDSTRWYFKGAVPADKTESNYQVGKISNLTETNGTLSVSLYAQHKALYNVTFYDHDAGDTFLATIGVMPGETIDSPHPTNKAGMTFDAWKLKDGSAATSIVTSSATKDKITFADGLDASQELYAYYVPSTHTITYTVTGDFTNFEADGVTTPTDTNKHTTATVAEGAKTLKPKYTIAANKEVRMWRDTKTGAEFTFGTTIDKDYTLFPVVETAYPVHFMAEASEGGNYTEVTALKATVFAGEKVSQPSPITAANAQFLGWYKMTSTTSSSNCTSKDQVSGDEFKFTDGKSNDAITAETWVYGKFTWGKTTHAVSITYEDATGTEIYPPVVQNIVDGSTATAPTVPAQDGKTFKRWIDVENPTQEFLFTTPIKKAYTVTFDTNGGSSVPSKTGIEYEKGIAVPADPSKTGYVFGGWFANKALTEPFYFATADNGTTEATTGKGYPPNTSGICGGRQPPRPPPPQASHPENDTRKYRTRRFRRAPFSPGRGCRWRSSTRSAGPRHIRSFGIDSRRAAGPPH